MKSPLTINIVKAACNSSTGLRNDLHGHTNLELCAKNSLGHTRTSTARCQLAPEKAMWLTPQAGHSAAQTVWYSLHGNVATIPEPAPSSDELRFIWQRKRRRLSGVSGVAAHRWPISRLSAADSEFPEGPEGFSLTCSKRSRV